MGFVVVPFLLVLCCIIDFQVEVTFLSFWSAGLGLVIGVSCVLGNCVGGSMEVGNHLPLIVHHLT